MGGPTLILRSNGKLLEHTDSGWIELQNGSPDGAGAFVVLAQERVEELRAELSRLAALDYADHCAAGGDDLEWTDAPCPRHDAFAASLGEVYQMLLALDDLRMTENDEPEQS